MCRQQHRAAEALDLKRTLRLRLRAAPQAVPANDRERTDDHEHDCSEREQRPGEASPPDGDAEEREQCRGINLGRKRQTQQREGKRRSLVQQRAQGAGDQQSRPDVVGVERDGA
jgi:hypothetical protein